MQELIHPPSAKALLGSLRAIGYSFEAALADIIDNSITADAQNIQISMRAGDSPYVAILDDGHGMSKDVLIEAMRHGGVGPGVARGKRDLGRYGLGLKTASLSQCRRLTVASIVSGRLSGARWDLDDIERCDDWLLAIPSDAQLRALPCAEELERQGAGTLVLWEKFDRATAGERSPGRAIERLLDGSRDYLALVFHRFISPDEGEQPISISINGLPLDPADPFLTANKRTEKLPAEIIHVEGEPVLIQPYILPHVSNIKDEELRKLGGRESLRHSQGFYIYRNGRLISTGTWFRLINQHELNKLARVQVDIPNTLDHLWDLDVKKSRAIPPEDVRETLKRIVDRIAERSQNVFKDRRRRSKNELVTHLWDRTNVRGGICYAINREHPFVSETLEALSRPQRRRLERLLTMLEVGLPVASIYADMAADRSVEMPSEKINNELSDELNNRLHAIGSNRRAREKFLEAVPLLDPFSMYPVITRKLVEGLK